MVLTHPWAPEGKRRRGRPRETWRRTVNKEREHLGFKTWSQAEVAPRDRVALRRKINGPILHAERRDRCCFLTYVTGILVTYFIYPVYNRQDHIVGKALIAIFEPLISVLLKGVPLFWVQRLWRISHQGHSFVLLVPLYYGSAVMLRLLQVDF